MKTLALILLFPLQASSQLITPEWRGLPLSNHAEWDIFTAAKFEPNAPDVSGANASITGTTSSAFLTSSGNIYSFQAPTFFQLDASSVEGIANVFLQIKALGSSIDLAGAMLIADDADCNPFAISPTHSMVISEEQLGGERGGIGTLYTLQWDLRATPITGDYTILFNATESSLSLDRVSLDTSESYQFVPKPEPFEIDIQGGQVHLTWLGSGQLQTSSSLDSGWTDIPEATGKNALSLPLTSGPVFFRVKQEIVTE